MLRNRPTVRVALVRIDQIRFHPANIRRELGDLRDLSDSILQYGVLQPVVVEHYGDTLRLRMGHRRVAAAQLAGLRTVPAVIHAEPLDEKSFLLQAVQENFNRAAVSASDRVRTVTRLRELGCSWRSIASAFHVSPKTAAGWVAGDDDEGPRASNPRRRAVLRLIEAHRDEFEQLLADERDRDEIRRVSPQWEVAA